MNRDSARRLVSAYFESPGVKLLTRLGLSPNAITALGFVIAVLGAYLIAIGQLLGGGIVFLLSGLLDLLDGAVARSTGKASAFGAVFDSIADRFSEAAVFLGILIFYLDSDAIWEPVLVFLALFTSLMVSYVRARAEGLDVECTVGVLQRPERVAILGIGLVVGHWWLTGTAVAIGLIALLALATTAQRVFHVRRELANRDGQAP